jgi:ubiquinone/menaquinone biosynthesis C-methylase UbiE
VQPAAKAGEINPSERIRQEYARRAEDLPADFYAWYRPENQYFQASARRAVTHLLTEAGAFPVGQTEIADIGCGNGQWLLEYLQWGAHPSRLHGIDLVETRIAYARERVPGADLHTGDASHLPWADASMDLVTQFTAFSSMPDRAMRKEASSEMVRITRRGGHILWYDIRSSKRGIGTAEISALFPGCAIQFRTATLAPPIARALVRLSWPAAFALETIPAASTHLAALIRV